MTQEDSTQIIFINSRSTAVKIALALAALAAVWGAYTVARWQIGKVLAETTQTSDRNFPILAKAAADLAPGDPFVYWTLGNAQKTGFQTEMLDAATKSYETAVRLAPDDYRYWLDLGRMRDQAGDRAGAESALRRAVELAPSYAYPRWLLGNLLLRANRRDEAFAEFRLVADSHSVLRQQVFYTLWDNTEQNAAEIERVVGNAPQVRSALALFYAQKDRPEDAVRVWQSLSQTEKEEFRADGVFTAQGLYGKGHFRAALSLFKELGVETGDVGKITNGGFESEISKPQETYFGWRVEKNKNLDVNFDRTQRREGQQSLRLNFSGYAQTSLQTLVQYVAVEPAERYRLSFQLKTTELRSAGTPVLEIVDAASNKPLGASRPFPGGTNDWQTMNIEFMTPTEVDAVLIRTARAFCGENCPIVGSIWYDDFKLERLGKGGK